MNAKNFEPLVNDKGLVLMRTAFAWAPYEADALYGFSPERAAELFDNKAAYPVDPVNFEPIPVMGEVLEVRAPIRPASGDVVIPQEWEKMHKLEIIKLACEVIGNPDQKMNLDDAKRLINAELNRRSEQDAVSQ
jgi:hypothetical protein